MTHLQAPTTAREFDALIESHFANQRGWFCLGYIDGDPTIEAMKQEWYFWPRQRTAIAERYAQLAAREFNLYWCACLFAARKRSYKNALPSPWLWQDDATAGTPCTELIQTSEHSYQAYLKLDRALNATERQHLQTAWRGVRATDACSANAVQFGRIPGGYNRKRHGTFLTYIVRHSDRINTNADSYFARYPMSTQQPKSAGIITDLAWPEVETHLANIDELLTSGRARCIKPDSQTGRILAGERVAIASTRLGRMDDSCSMQGAILAYGFYCRGFTDDEIAAVIFHFYREWGVEARKGTAWCKDDIGRVIAHAHAKKPGVVQSPTRYKKDVAPAPIVEQPAASRARSDRPTKLDPPMLFNRYRQQPALCELSRKPRAAALGISTATLDRLEDALELWGLIEIETLPKRAGSRVHLAGVINIGAPEVLSASNGESAELCAPIAQNDDRGPQCIGETHPPREAPPPPAAPRRLADLVREAFDQVLVDRETGEKRRVTRKRLMIALGPLARSDAAIDRAIADERQRRRIAAIVAEIRSMQASTLRQQIRLMERLADKSRDQGTNLHKYADWAAREMRGELASRPPEPGRKPRKNCEVLPDLRATGERYYAELFDLVDQARATMPKPAPIAVAVKPSGEASVGVCSPNPPPAAAGPPDALGLIARLKQDHAQRQAAAS